MEEYGNDFIVLVDDDGNESEFEHLHSLDYKDNTYMAFIPANESEDSEEAAELVILKATEENGEEVLVSVDDDDELEAVYKLFLAELEEYFEVEEKEEKN